MTAPDRYPPAHVSFDEYQMFYQSAERVTDRRRDLNKWNYSVMTLTLFAIGGVLAWSSYRIDREFVGCVGVIGMSLMAALHCSYWIRQIDDFKALNTEKFRLLNDMAPLVRFAETRPGITLRSYEPFRREWDAMDELDQLAEIRRSGVGRMLALKSSSAEYTMAQVFRYAFLLVALGTIGLLGSDFHDVIHHITPFANR
ncbi:MAG TPA: hypothetical protein VH442_15650 [Micromonosporaceae bacterium]